MISFSEISNVNIYETALCENKLKIEFLVVAGEYFFERPKLLIENIQHCIKCWMLVLLSNKVTFEFQCTL
jgi:hypothetical protein